MNKKKAESTRTISFVFSDESRDTYGTILSADKWDLKRFNKIGVAFYNHNGRSGDPDQTIGTARAWVEGKKLVGKIKFEEKELNPIAEKVFRKVLAGTLRCVSVGFMPLERGSFGEGEEAVGGKNETYYYGRCELLEISVTPMPANKNALVRSVGADPIGETMERMELDAELRMEEGEDEPEDKQKPEEENTEETENRALLIELNARSAIAMSMSNN